MPTESLPDAPATMDNRQLRRLLNVIGACDRGQEWLGGRDLTTAWAECPRGDHLLWVCASVGIDRRLIVRAAAACAETVLQDVPKGDDRPRLAIAAARAWADDPSDETRLRAMAAAHAAADPAYATSLTYPTYAASAAAYAAYAVTYPAYVSYAATYPSYARTDAPNRCAAIVRGHIPFEAVLAAARQTLERRR